ncbi:MAG TPA: ROK family protein [Actinomycetaceae bacterium]|nr:ROK family protein [Actinomycetaceae bacterium]
MRPVTTLSIDCGGGGIKGSVLDPEGALRSNPIRAVTPYPLPPERLVGVIRSLSGQLPAADRVTVGMPGMIRRGIVVSTPHYICRAGPRTRVVPELVTAWEMFDMRAAVEEALGIPARVLNDAEMHGYGLIRGVGLEMVMTLGTGLGNAVFDDGVLAPHMELSQAPGKWGLTYDEYLGEHERIRLGDSHWSRRVRGVVESWQPVFLWDRLYIGGGNAPRITPATLARLGVCVTIAANSAGIAGGVRAWGPDSGTVSRTEEGTAPAATGQ